MITAWSVAAGAGSNEPPSNVLEWFTDLEYRANSGSIPEQAWITIWHSALAVTIVAMLAVPLAVWLAHHRKAELIAPWVINIGRAVPTITIVGILVIISLRAGYGLEPWPIVIALVLLGLPPTFTNAYTGVRGVDPSAVDASRAMGFTHRQVMQRVELPLALPLIMAGIRIATVQIVATEPLAAFFGSDGLGAFLRAGLADRLYGGVQVQSAALLVAGLAIAADVALLGVTRLVVPKGVRIGTPSTRVVRRRPVPAPST
jgi:osmoprotectant transport system permease protein